MKNALRSGLLAYFAVRFCSRVRQLKVDVIVTVGSAIPAVKRATSTIPIVFAVAVDPLGSGFVSSLARPGGNITGLSLQSTDMTGKRIELLVQMIPGTRSAGGAGQCRLSGSAS